MSKDTQNQTHEKSKEERRRSVGTKKREKYFSAFADAFCVKINFFGGEGPQIRKRVCTSREKPHMYSVHRCKYTFALFKTFFSLSYLSLLSAGPDGSAFLQELEVSGNHFGDVFTVQNHI